MIMRGIFIFAQELRYDYYEDTNLFELVIYD